MTTNSRCMHPHLRLSTLNTIKSFLPLWLRPLLTSSRLSFLSEFHLLLAYHPLTTLLVHQGLELWHAVHLADLFSKNFLTLGMVLILTASPLLTTATSLSPGLPPFTWDALLLRRERHHDHPFPPFLPLCLHRLSTFHSLARLHLAVSPVPSTFARNIYLLPHLLL